MLPLLDDLEAGAQEGGFAHAGVLDRITAWDLNAASGPEFRVDQQGQIGAAERVHHAIQPCGVIEVAVAEHDRLNVLWRMVEAAHVFDESIGAGAGIEEDAMRPSFAADGDER